MLNKIFTKNNPFLVNINNNKHSVNCTLHASDTTAFFRVSLTDRASPCHSEQGLLDDHPGTLMDSGNLSRGCPGLLTLMETMRPGLLSCMKTRSMCGISWGR